MFDKLIDIDHKFNSQHTLPRISLEAREAPLGYFLCSKTPPRLAIVEDWELKQCRVLVSGGSDSFFIFVYTIQEFVSQVNGCERAESQLEASRMNSEMGEYPTGPGFEQPYPQTVWYAPALGFPMAAPMDQRGYFMPTMAPMGGYGMYEAEFDDMVPPGPQSSYATSHPPALPPAPLIVPPTSASSDPHDLSQHHPGGHHGGAFREGAPASATSRKRSEKPGGIASAPAASGVVAGANDYTGGGPDPELSWTDVSHLERCGVPVGSASRANMRVRIDKGFTWIRGHGFTCHKKNHFQVTVDLQADGPIERVRPQGDENESSVVGLHLEMFGVKQESPGDRIQLLQATLSRERDTLQRQELKQDPGTYHAAVTVPRLHFSTSTENNVRKKGRANPLQRYFQLVVRLVASTTDGAEIPLAVLMSEQFVVRASSPRLLQKVDSTWRTAVSGKPAIFFEQNVGINYQVPDEDLTVGGNCKITGEMYQPSDIRVKQAVTPLDPARELAALSHLGLYTYTLRPEWADAVGRAANPIETGVVAQELAAQFPDAVKRKPGLGCRLADGTEINNLLLVKKERLGTALLAAVQAVADRGDVLRRRLERAERETDFLLTQLGQARS